MGVSFLNLVATKVTVKGEEQKFVSLRLHQGFNRHHTFTIIVNYLSPNNTFQQTPEKFINYIGETVNISFVHKQTGKGYDFEGIINQVEMIGSVGETGGVAIHGASPTILYENNKTLDSWTDQTLSAIIKEVTQEYGKVNLVSNPEYNLPIPYMAQYNESVFDFMNRLSALYGEWFYYDGAKTYFGKPDKEDDPTKILYDVDLEEVRLVANLVPGKSARYDYVAQENKIHNADTPAKPEGMNDLQSIAHGCSEKAYSARTTSAANPHITDKAGLDEQMKIVKNSSGAGLLNIKGIGKTCLIRIGEVIDVAFPDRMKLSPLGKFRITEITHEVHRDGHYVNSFVGIPDQTVHIPVPNVKMPLALPELATVEKNDDEKGQGRVKVAFDWQKGKTTNWIRVQSPNAGTSNAVSKNRGWVFVPEVGDQVMVGYEHGNPDRPYVTGAIFHKDSGKGGDKDNKLKSIITRSGNTILFDDETGSITIMDQTGKQLILLDGKDTINIMAKKTVTITNEEESVIIMDGKSIGLQSDTISIEGRKSITLLSGGENMILSGEKKIIGSSGTNIKQEASKEYDLSTQKGTVKGTNLAIEGTADVAVTGGVIKLNS